MTFEPKKRHKHVINVTLWHQMWHFFQKKNANSTTKGKFVKSYFFKTKKYSLFSLHILLKLVLYSLITLYSLSNRHSRYSLYSLHIHIPYDVNIAYMEYLAAIVDSAQILYFSRYTLYVATFEKKKILKFLFILLKNKE